MVILCCCICSIFVSWFPTTKKKNQEKFLLISLPSYFRGHSGLAKYRTVWATFSRYFQLHSFSLACAIRIVNAYVSITAASWQPPQQLDCRENWINAYKIHQCFQNDHPSSIDLWIPLQNWMHTSWKSYGHNRISETKVSLPAPAIHHHLPKILMMK